jgi:CDP-diacylglycerol--glycerol-3-phosphate 3-phosphatidyltransferase
MSATRSSSTLWNVPNQITAARLILSIVVFLLISFQLYIAALVCFVIAAATDWVDGYWARKYNQVTQLGRIFDPFVDKIIICGTFIFLAAEAHRGSGVAPWMAVVVMGREMLVTVLRSVIEGAGGDFSANMAGKWKMVFQCAAVVASLLSLFWLQSGTADAPAILPEWLWWTRTVCVWLALVSTVYSGVIYIFAAARQMPK